MDRWWVRDFGFCWGGFVILERWEYLFRFLETETLAASPLSSVGTLASPADPIPPLPSPVESPIDDILPYVHVLATETDAIVGFSSVLISTPLLLPLLPPAGFSV